MIDVAIVPIRTAASLASGAFGWDITTSLNTLSAAKMTADKRDMAHPNTKKIG